MNNKKLIYTVLAAIIAIALIVLSKKISRCWPTYPPQATSTCQM